MLSLCSSLNLSFYVHVVYPFFLMHVHLSRKMHGHYRVEERKNKSLFMTVGAIKNGSYSYIRSFTEMFEYPFCISIIIGHFQIVNTLECFVF